jgi:hypothetical protein
MRNVLAVFEGNGASGLVRDTVRQITAVPETERDNPLFENGKRYLCHLKIKPEAPKKRVRINSMATSITTGFSPSATAPAAASAASPRPRHRRITPEAGRALEILGHAIEYLTDEFVHRGGSFSAHDEQLQAVQLLMALNRQVYFECPEIPSFGERCRALLHLHTA